MQVGCLAACLIRCLEHSAPRRSTTFANTIIVCVLNLLNQAWASGRPGPARSTGKTWPRPDPGPIGRPGSARLPPPLPSLSLSAVPLAPPLLPSPLRRSPSALPSRLPLRSPSASLSLSTPPLPSRLPLRSPSSVPLLLLLLHRRCCSQRATVGGRRQEGNGRAGRTRPGPRPRLSGQLLPDRAGPAQCPPLLKGRAQVAQLELIDSLERLGVVYHFESETRQSLDAISMSTRGFQDLYSFSLRFRILRQYGYNISAECFSRFRDQSGWFSKNLREEVRELLSIYEASQLACEGETVLEEALAFSSEHLRARIS
ncbi:Viridiflorene synthase [Nymphaea thermarum]|nr:Viridiflorene synthase [Nymphaea thermarum]